MNKTWIRNATADDAGLLLQLIRELAAYERAPDAVVATEDDLRRHGFGPERRFEALVALSTTNPPVSRCSIQISRPGAAGPASISKISMSESGREAAASGGC